uniref:Uncharacterized protein n=1 Tax=Rhizophora mucronata TaxID=61149 RepID=A0A2P2R2C6_RHIMU
MVRYKFYLALNFASGVFPSYLVYYIVFNC